MGTLQLEELRESQLILLLFKAASLYTAEWIKPCAVPERTEKPSPLVHVNTLSPAPASLHVRTDEKQTRTVLLLGISKSNSGL